MKDDQQASPPVDELSLLKSRFVLNQLAQAIEERERTLAREHDIPDAQRLFGRRATKAMEALGAAFLGVITGMLSVLAVFVILQRFLHIGAGG